MWDAMYNLLVAEDSISPEKYVVEGYPTIKDFPPAHANSPKVATSVEKEEL